MKSNKKKITFIPKNEFVIEYTHKPEPMVKNLPAWWRKVHPYVNGEKKVIRGQYNETVKKCPGILDLLSTGYLLKTPCDIYVDATGPKLTWQVHDAHKESVAVHSQEQVEGWDFDKEEWMEDIFRIHPMWVVATSKGYSTLFIQPSFHTSLPFEIVPAIVDTDLYPSDGPFSMRIKRGFKGILEAGTPLVQCIPYKREEWESNILEKPDLKVLGSIPWKLRHKFGGAYKRLMWEKKVFN
ncbi:MAG: hypothetical protein EBV27_03175 [Actinobacteria bacterium]|jgi:hypothetical protein|nr:hypothetical protein [Actinomycetota bacterium]